MTPTDAPPGPDALELAHLAYLRGQFAQANQMLQALLADQPDNRAAQDLLAQVSAKEDTQAQPATKTPMIPSSSVSDPFEQARLAWTRGRLPEARMLLETLVEAEPNNVAAQDLLARVALKQSDDAQRRIRGGLWDRNIVSNGAVGCLLSGLLLFFYGIATAIPALQAGFAHGFGPHATVMESGKYGIATYADSVSSVLWRSFLRSLVGFLLLCLFYWDTFKRRK